MTRQSISLTTPNDDWLKAQIGSGREFTSKSDVMNHLIRQARADQEKIEVIRSRLISAEQGGFVPSDRNAILASFKDTLHRDV